MNPDWEQIKKQFEEVPLSHHIEMLNKIMKDNPPSETKGKSDWYKRLEKTKECLEDEKVDRSVMLSVTMAQVGL